VSTATTIIFYSPDRDPDFHLRLITYALTGTVLTRSVQTSNETNLAVGTTGNWTFPAVTTNPVVLTGVITLLFTYLDQASPPVVATTGAALQSVLVDLVVNQTPRSSPIPQTYHTQVDLRVTN
jgi:hypothetical protein